MGTQPTNKLDWFVGSNGNHFADAVGNRYCIALEDGPLGRYYSLSVNGEGIRYRSLGGSNDFARAKAMAQSHAETGRV